MENIRNNRSMSNITYLKQCEECSVLVEVIEEHEYELCEKHKS